MALLHRLINEEVPNVRGISSFSRWLETCTNEELDEVLSDAINDKDNSEKDNTITMMIMAAYKERNFYKPGRYNTRQQTLGV